MNHTKEFNFRATLLADPSVYMPIHFAAVSIDNCNNIHAVMGSVISRQLVVYFSNELFVLFEDEVMVLSS